MQDFPVVSLPEPTHKGDSTFEELIAKRESKRSFEPGYLTLAQLSQLLWAAYGLNESGGMKRTVPSAGARFPLTILACVGEGTVEGLEPGIWEYVAEENTVGRLSNADVRKPLAAAALGQHFIAQAPLCIAVVADFDKTSSRYGERGVRYVYIDVGHVGQNIYLQAVSLGLGTVAIGAFDDSAVAKVLNLAPDLAPIYLMPVGYTP